MSNTYSKGELTAQGLDSAPEGVSILAARGRWETNPYTIIVAARVGAIQLTLSTQTRVIYEPSVK